MKRLFWLLLASCLIGSGPVSAEDSDLVRVEVLVFQHAGGQSDRWPMPVTETFAELPDPITQASEIVPTVPADSPAREPVVIDTLGPSWPPLYVDMGQHSEMFQRALARLQSSSEYQVLSNLSWIQPLARNARPQAVRIRGTKKLFQNAEPEPPSRLVFGRAIDSEPTKTATRYQLDGSITVRQRQFRHVDLDLVWQEPEFSDRDVGMLSPVVTGDDQVLTHRLQTSRPIGLDRLEYFDSPWLGVIVLVQDWSRPDPAADASQPAP